MTMTADEKPRKLSETLRLAGSTFPGARVKQEDCVQLTKSTFMVRGQMSLKKAMKAYARIVKVPVGDSLSSIHMRRSPKYPCVVVFNYQGDRISANTVHVSEYAHQLAGIVNMLSGNDVVAADIFSKSIKLVPQLQESKSK